MLGRVTLRSVFSMNAVYMKARKYLYLYIFIHFFSKSRNNVLFLVQLSLRSGTSNTLLCLFLGWWLWKVGKCGEKTFRVIEDKNLNDSPIYEFTLYPSHTYEINTLNFPVNSFLVYFKMYLFLLHIPYFLYAVPLPLLFLTLFCITFAFSVSIFCT